jgi:CHAD domain-containing protein
VLEYRSGAGGGALVLTTPGGAALSDPITRPRWPATLDRLPAGPVRQRLEPVVGIRALLPVVTASTSRRELRVLNADDKTVARVILDRLVPATSRGGVPPEPLHRLTVGGVRGYDVQADRACRLVAALPGVATADTPLPDALLAAVGHVGRESAPPRLAATMPAAPALAAVLLYQLDVLEANVDGTLRDLDTEFLHDLRVAVRRTRSAVKLCRAALPAKLTETFAPELRWLGDVTTPVRDLDVYVLGYPDMAASLRAAEPADLEPFHAYLLGRRGTERRRLVRALRSTRFTDLTAAWRAALDRLTTAPDQRALGGLADSVLRRAHRRVLTLGSAIAPASPPTHLHDLRKRCKELRYLLEFFAPLLAPDAQRATKDLKALQDCLGAYQDNEVQRDAIRTFAAEMLAARTAPVATLLAMGELVARLDARQRAARDEFATRFAAFARDAAPLTRAGAR